ncbi:MAG: DNA primase [Treponema sp.]|nr:DNA primase [Treponema sp.]
MANFISKESIDEVSSKADIVSIIQEYVPLEQKGNDWWGCCPFHHEKTPSFSVSADKKFYYCFGCHASGTVFNFIMQMENVSYGEAVEILAKKAGVQLRYTQKGPESNAEDPKKKLKDEYTQLYTRIASSFHYMLMETESGKFALDYITKRGITKETLEKFKIGYSPADRKWLRNFLEKKNYSKQFLDESGLFSKKYPEIAFFSDRLMFPIFNREGEVVAMGGRFLRGDPEKSPKYLNSGDLIQYKKGNTLYAFNFAKQAIRENRKVIFCEGYMDCIAYHQCGIKYAVAPLGTALTDDQITLVKNIVDEILLSFDSDGAGQKATRRAILMCRRHNIPVKIIQLHGGKDPAEIMQTFGVEYLTNEVNKAILDNDFLISKLLEVYPKDTPMGKSRASLEFFEYIDSLQDNIQKEACLEQLCQAFQIDKEAARKDFVNRKDFSSRMKNADPEQKKAADGQQKIILTAELQAVMTAVNEDPQYFQQMQNEIQDTDLEDENSRKLFLTMKDCMQSNNFSVSSILNGLDSDAFRELVINTMHKFSDSISESVEGSIKYLKRNALQKKKNLLKGKIDQLVKSSLPEDKNLLSDFLKQKQEIDFQIENMKV